MAGSSLQRLFHLGAVGTMTDAQLVDLFLSRRDDEAAEAAFEELVSRHGPMVLRVCRDVLRDDHDAEDAFQAVFLVLAGRAGSIRRRDSIASWLFGVAHRVAGRARRSAARRRRMERTAAEQTSKSAFPADPSDGEALHEEIDILPGRLRAPVVLCYLQGLTYAAAAQQLGVSEVAVRSRLARARERLRRRLTRRGLTLPAGFLVTGATGQTRAAVSLSLIHSTVHIAMGFAAGQTAAVLARGVLNAMLLNQVKAAVVLLLVGIGGGSWAWHALASPAEGESQPDQGKVTSTTAPSPKPKTTKPTAAYRLTGSVRVEGTGEPVAGAMVEVMVADSGQRHRGADRMVRLGRPVRCRTSPRQRPFLDANSARRLLGSPRFPEVRGVCRLQGRARPP